jgi:hypothetical protein
MPTSDGVGTFRDRFAARFDYRYMGLAVVCTETATDVWDITTYPGTASLSSAGDGIPVGLDINAADYVFYGTNTYTVTGSLATALSNAGYTVT